MRTQSSTPEGSDLTFVLLFAGRALDEEVRARIVNAVRVIVARGAALMAHAQYIICYRFSLPWRVFEYKV